MTTTTEYPTRRYAALLEGRAVTLTVRREHYKDTDESPRNPDNRGAFSPSDVRAWTRDEWEFKTLEVEVVAEDNRGWSKSETASLGGVAVWPGKWDLRDDDERWGWLARDACRALGVRFPLGQNPFAGDAPVVTQYGFAVTLRNTAGPLPGEDPLPHVAQGFANKLDEFLVKIGPDYPEFRIEWSGGNPD